MQISIGDTIVPSMSSSICVSLSGRITEMTVAHTKVLCLDGRLSVMDELMWVLIKGWYIWIEWKFPDIFYPYCAS